MVKKTMILLIYIFLQFYLTSLRGNEYFAKEPEPVGAGCFWPLGARAGARVALEKNQESEPEPLKKK